MEDAKGVQRIIDAFGSLETLQKVAVIHFIGDGQKMNHYRDQSKALNLPANFHGFLERDRVFEIYKQSHFFLLPSTASEGFPKVIAEAMNFGCIPLVSSVSSIGQYVNKSNGFIVNPCTSDELSVLLDASMNKKEEFLIKKAFAAHQAVIQFTFEHYRKRIQNEVIV